MSGTIVRMRLRAVLPLLFMLWLLGLLAACATGPRAIEIPQQQLQAALERRFPWEARPGGLLVMNVGVPQLRLLPQENRLRVDFTAEPSDRMMRGAPRGTFSLSFGLRYAPADASIRATEVRVEQVEVQGVPQELRGFLQLASALVAENLLDGAVLYTLRPEDVARAGGWTPGDIRVTPGGVRVELLPPAALSPQGS